MHPKARLLVMDGSITLDMENEIDATPLDKHNKLVITSFVKIATIPATRAGTLLIIEHWVTVSHAVPFENLQEWEKELIKHWENYESQSVDRVNAERTEAKVLLSAIRILRALHADLRFQVLKDVNRNVLIEYTTDESNPGDR